MKTKKQRAQKAPTKKDGRRALAVGTGSPLIPASKLLRAEATRLDVLMHAMPDQSRNLISAQVWAHNLSAAFLDSLGAPEKLQRYVPANTLDPIGKQDGASQMRRAGIC